VVADAVRYEPQSNTMRSTCSEDAPASLTFLNLPASGIVSGAIGDPITIDVEARDQNPLQIPVVHMIGVSHAFLLVSSFSIRFQSFHPIHCTTHHNADTFHARFFQVPTPNATFEQLSPNQVVLTERGLLMEIYSSKDQSNSDQCRCDEIGSNLGTPKTLYVPLVEFNSFNFKQMKGPSPLLQYDFGPLYAHHIKVRFTGMLRIRQTGAYVFKAKSDDCVTV
tara:strand:+ start:31 stop:696 length:666 start_codon:yes stop_codon:yes gene_type:complete